MEKNEKRFVDVALKGKLRLGHSILTATGTDHLKIHTKGFKDVVMLADFNEVRRVLEARERLIVKRKIRKLAYA